MIPQQNTYNLKATIQAPWKWNVQEQWQHKHNAKTYMVLRKQRIQYINDYQTLTQYVPTERELKTTKPKPNFCNFSGPHPELKLSLWKWKRKGKKGKQESQWKEGRARATQVPLVGGNTAHSTTITTTTSSSTMIMLLVLSDFSFGFLYCRGFLMWMLYQLQSDTHIQKWKWQQTHTH